jgi:hypothetical protein
MSSNGSGERSTLGPAWEEATTRRATDAGVIDQRESTQNQHENVTGNMNNISGTRRRRRSTQPQVSVFIKGPKNILDWFINYTNERGHRSYWETLEEFRLMMKE